jgi:hypothetical protein
MSKPISPKQARELKTNSIPKIVFKAFNELIAENLDSNNNASFDQEKVVKRINEYMKISGYSIFERGWMDIEPFYRKNGWNVEYVKGAYYDTFIPYFEFRKKK